MAKILLDYVFPITLITPVPAASTAYLKQVLIVVKPRTGQEVNVGTIYECTNLAQVAVRTLDVNAEQLFNAGMSKIFLLLADNLQISTFLIPRLGDFFTILASDDYSNADIAGVKAAYVPEDITFRAKVVGTGGNAITVVILDNQATPIAVVSRVVNAITIGIQAAATTATTLAAAVTGSADISTLIDATVTGTGSDPQAARTVANLTGGLNAINVGLFKGVVGVSSDNIPMLTAQAAIENRVPFFVNASNGSKNMFFAFGKLLSNPSNWTNQQYVPMPFTDAVDELGEANTLFDAKISFVLDDTEFGKRLALFAAGGKAIVAPYISENLRVDMQSRALQWITANQPSYTKKNASLLEVRLQEDVINSYILVRKWITAGVVSITLVQQNFVANGNIDIAEPKALWRVLGEFRQTL